MGSKVCNNIIEGGFQVTCFDKRKESYNQLRGNFNTVENIESVFTNSEIIFLSLPGSQEVEEVTTVFLTLSGTAKTVIDLSTSYPASTKQIYEKFKQKNWHFADAPLSGTPEQARQGELNILFGGDQATYNKCLPIMKTFGKKVHYMGEAGSGNITKLINNYFSIMYGILYAEGFAFAKKAGMDVKHLFDVIGESGVNCGMYQHAGRKIVEENDDPVFALKLGLKDLTYFKQLHEDSQLPALVLDSGLNLLRIAKSHGLEERDITATSQVIQNMQK